jgi:prepilin-type N-terminal cleavage/methylation domain-containing protein
VPPAGAGRPHHMHQQHPYRSLGSSSGFTMVEVLFALALAATVLSMAIAFTRDAVDELRTAMAARYLAARLMEARIGAVTRSACVGLRFVPEAGDYRFAPFADGNGNGIRSVDIALGIDVPIGRAETLGEKFPGVTIGLMNGYPDADNNPGTGADGVRIGKARIETMSPDGTATAGTVYLHGRRSQYAVRVLGTTGRVRVLQYRPAGDVWMAR